jgi:hypothetical protein
MLLRIIVLGILSGPFIGHAQQYLPRDFGSLSFSALSGSGILEFNSSLTQNLALDKRHHRFHLSFGARASYIVHSNNLDFSPARDPEPTFTQQKSSLNLGTINLLFGFSTCLTSKFILAVDAELLGVSFGGTQSGELMLGGKNYDFDSKPLGTNFLLNGTNGGNLLHTISLGYLYNPELIFKIGAANQGVVYNYKSSLDGFANFTKSNYTTAGFISIEWLFGCVK